MTFRMILLARVIYKIDPLLFVIEHGKCCFVGKQWDPEKVVLLTQNEGDKLPSVVSRGNSLNGSSYSSPSKPRQSKNFPQVELNARH